MKKILLLLVLGAGLFSAQNVGINTNSPQQTLHIDGAKDNSSTGAPTAAQTINDVVITSDGKIGVGTINPVAKVDLRGAGTANAVGIGTTSQTAVAAGAGAVRYSSYSGGTIQFSDGVNWFNLLSNTQKVSVIQKVFGSPSVSSGTPTFITSWKSFADTHNAFNNGVFTAPRTGIYLVTATYNFNNIESTASTPFYTNATSEIRFIVNNNAATPYTKCVKNFGEVSATWMQVGGYCIVGISLKQGETLSIQLYQRINGTTANLRNDNSAATFGFNNLTINEQ